MHCFAALLNHPRLFSKNRIKTADLKKSAVCWRDQSANISILSEISCSNPISAPSNNTVSKFWSENQADFRVRLPVAQPKFSCWPASETGAKWQLAFVSNLPGQLPFRLKISNCLLIRRLSISKRTMHFLGMVQRKHTKPNYVAPIVNSQTSQRLSSIPNGHAFQPQPTVGLRSERLYNWNNPPLA